MSLSLFLLFSHARSTSTSHIFCVRSSFRQSWSPIRLWGHALQCKHSPWWGAHFFDAVNCKQFSSVFDFIILSSFFSPPLVDYILCSLLTPLSPTSMHSDHSNNCKEADVSQPTWSNYNFFSEEHARAPLIMDLLTQKASGLRPHQLPVLTWFVPAQPGTRSWWATWMD